MSTELDPQGVNHEIEFWKRFVQSERFLKGWVPDEPTPELNHDVRRLILMRDGLSLVSTRILDVGSGPVSILHGIGGHVRVTTMDPLSNLYQEIFDYAEHGIDPPLPYAAEDADQGCELNCLGYFDVVHISNALDHCVNPVAALHSLAKCTESSRGWLIVQGFVDEATHENHAGFHQHDLHLHDEILVVRSDRGETTKAILAKELGFDCVWAQQEPLPALGREWFIWILQRK